MRKIIIRIFNLIFLVLAAVSITAFATKDFVALDVTYPLTKEFVVEKIGSQLPEQIKQEDLEEAFADGVELKINVSIPAKSLFQSTKDKTAVSTGIKESVNNTVNGLVDALHDPLNVIVEKVAKNTAKEQAAQSIKDQIKDALPSGNKDKADEIFNERVKDEDITQLTDEMYETMKSGEATVDGIVDGMADNINKILKDIEAGEAENPTGFVYQEFDPNSEQGTQIKDALNEALNQFGLVDSEGKITDADTAMAILIDQLLNQGSNALSNSEDKTDDSSEGEGTKDENPTSSPRRTLEPPFSLEPEYTVEAGKQIQITAEGATEHEALVWCVANDNPVGCVTVESLDSSNPSENKAYLTGVAEGTAEIYVTCPGFEESAHATVTVTAMQKSIEFKNKPIIVDANKTRKLEIERNELVDPAATVTYELSEVNPEGCVTLEGDTLTAGDVAGTAKIKAICDGAEVTEDVTVRKVKSLKETLHEIVDKYVNDSGVFNYVDEYSGYLVYVVIAAMFPWALFALVTIIRTIRKEKCWTKPWIVFFFAFLELIFGAGLFFALGAFKGPILNALSSIPMIAEYADIIAPIGISLSTSCLIPSFIYLGMIVLTIVYMIICHKQKKNYKQIKKDKKAAKKAAKAA